MRADLVEVNDQKLHGPVLSRWPVGRRVFLPVKPEFVTPDAGQVAHPEFANLRRLAHHLDLVLNPQPQRLVRLIDALGDVLHGSVLACSCAWPVYV